MHNKIQQLIGKLIVSCQAYEDTPLYGPEYMKAMAASAILGGASGIRACWKQDIEAIRTLGDFPIIGLNKIAGDGGFSGVFITPTLESAIEVIEAGTDILALDCSIGRGRGKDELYELLKQIKDNYPGIAIMADCSSLEDAIFAEKTGLVDVLATTLSANAHIFGKPDIQFILDIKKNCQLPVNAEGSIWELEDLKNVIDTGADMITIGTAITRPHLITERFVGFYNNYKKDEKGL